MKIFKISLDGDTVSIDGGVMGCTCQKWSLNMNPYPACEHTDKVIRDRLDSAWISSILEQDDAISQAISVPLFTYQGSIIGTRDIADPSAKQVYYMLPCLLLRSRSPRGPFLRTLIKVPPVIDELPSSAQIPGSLKMNGEMFAPVGTLVKGCGIVDIRNNISAWTTTQLEMSAGKELECDSFIHSANPSSEKGHQLDHMSILLSGECMVCHSTVARTEDDVPKF